MSAAAVQPFPGTHRADAVPSSFALAAMDDVETVAWRRVDLLWGRKP